MTVAVKPTAVSLSNQVAAADLAVGTITACTFYDLHSAHAGPDLSDPLVSIVAVTAGRGLAGTAVLRFNHEGGLRKVSIAGAIEVHASPLGTAPVEASRVDVKLYLNQALVATSLEGPQAAGSTFTIFDDLQVEPQDEVNLVFVTSGTGVWRPHIRPQRAALRLT